MSTPTLFVSLGSLVVGLSSLPANAGLVASYEIGIGTHTASIQIDQEDGDAYLFNVHWSGGSYTSWQAMLDADAALEGLSLQYDTYSWGVFLTGVTIDGDTDFGFGDLWPIENYWHFWLHDTAEWEMASFGATERALFDGARDAWVFGSPIAPQGVPAPGALALTLAWSAVCRGRCRSARRRASPGH